MMDTLVGCAFGENIGLHYTNHSLKKYKTGDYASIAYFLSQSLVKNKEYNSDAIIKFYKKCFLLRETENVGNNTKKTFSNLVNGKEWFESGADEDISIEPLVRTIPICAYYRKSKNQLLSNVKLDTYISTYSVEVEDVAVALASCIYHIYYTSSTVYSQKLKAIAILKDTIGSVSLNNTRHQLQKIYHLLDSSIPLSQGARYLVGDDNITNIVSMIIFFLLRKAPVAIAIDTAMNTINNYHDIVGCILGGAIGLCYGMYPFSIPELRQFVEEYNLFEQMDRSLLTGF